MTQKAMCRDCSPSTHPLNDPDCVLCGRYVLDYFVTQGCKTTFYYIYLSTGLHHHASERWGHVPTYVTKNDRHGMFDEIHCGRCGVLMTGSFV